METNLKGWQGTDFWINRFIQFLNLDFSSDQIYSDLCNLLDELLPCVSKSHSKLATAFQKLSSIEGIQECLNDVTVICNTVDTDNKDIGYKDLVVHCDSLISNAAGIHSISQLVNYSDDVLIITKNRKKVTANNSLISPKDYSKTNLACLQLVCTIYKMQQQVNAIIDLGRENTLRKKTLKSHLAAFKTVSGFKASLKWIDYRPVIKLVKFKNIHSKNIGVITTLISHSILAAISKASDVNRIGKCLGCNNFLYSNWGSGRTLYHSKKTIPPGEGTQCKDRYHNRKRLGLE